MSLRAIAAMCRKLIIHTFAFLISINVTKSLYINLQEGGQYPERCIREEVPADMIVIGESALLTERRVRSSCGFIA